MGDTFAEVGSNIRACIVSSQAQRQQLSLRELNKEYQELIGESIPFKQFQYQKIEDFLAAVPDLILNRVGSELYISVRPNEKIAHIDKLVKQQKSTKKKKVIGKKKFGRAPVSSSYQTIKKTWNHAPLGNRMNVLRNSNSGSTPDRFSGSYPPDRQFQPGIPSFASSNTGRNVHALRTSSLRPSSAVPGEYAKRVVHDHLDRSRPFSKGVDGSVRSKSQYRSQTTEGGGAHGRRTPELSGTFQGSVPRIPARMPSEDEYGSKSTEGGGANGRRTPELSGTFRGSVPRIPARMPSRDEYGSKSTEGGAGANERRTPELSGTFQGSVPRIPARMPGRDEYRSKSTEGGGEDERRTLESSGTLHGSVPRIPVRMPSRDEYGSKSTEDGGASERRTPDMHCAVPRKPARMSSRDEDHVDSSQLPSKLYAHHHNLTADDPDDVIHAKSSDDDTPQLEDIFNTMLITIKIGSSLRTVSKSGRKPTLIRPLSSRTPEENKSAITGKDSSGTQSKEMNILHGPGMLLRSALFQATSEENPSSSKIGEDSPGTPSKEINIHHGPGMILRSALSKATSEENTSSITTGKDGIKYEYAMDSHQVHSKSLPLLHLEVKQQLFVNFTKIIDPSYFIMQPSSYKNELETLSANLKIFYDIQKPPVSIGTIRMGNLFAVRNPDFDVWSRGRVVEVYPDVDQVSLLCIDYGNVILVNFQNIYDLMQCFQELPALAIKAELSDILPIADEWTARDCLRFRALLKEPGDFFCVIVDVVADTVEVLLYHNTNESWMDISQVLVDEKRAVNKYRI